MQSMTSEQLAFTQAGEPESVTTRVYFPHSVDASAQEDAAAAPVHGGPASPVSQGGEVPAARPIIEMRNLQKTYLLGSDGIPALRGVSMSIQPGELVAIYGTSGSGKSTLLSTVGTIDRHSKGDLHLFGQLVTERHASDAELARIRLHQIGFVFQSFNLLPTLTAIENVELPMVLAGQLSATDRRRRARYLLGKVGMTHRERSVPAQLSGGEQQRVTIARALANQPSLLLLDEPTGDLDTRNTDVIMNYLLELHQETGMTFVMVTHDVSLRHYADRVIQMSDGKVIDDVRVEDAKKLRAREKLRALVAQPASSSSGQSSTDQSRFTVVRQPSQYRALLAAAPSH